MRLHRRAITHHPTRRVARAIPLLLVVQVLGGALTPPAARASIAQVRPIQASLSTAPNQPPEPSSLATERAVPGLAPLAGIFNCSGSNFSANGDYAHLSWPDVSAHGW